MSRARPIHPFKTPSFTENLKPIAFAILWLCLLSQIAWMITTERDDGFGTYKLVNVIGFGLLAIGGSRNKVIVVLMRLVLAATFLGSVADRFGLLGAPGTAGVSWGSFSNFIDYTRDVTSFLPSSLAPVLAVIATCVETLLGLGLVFGTWQRSAALGSTILLVVFGISMTVSLGSESTFSYSVWLLASGSWVLSQPIASRWLAVSPGWKWNRETLSLTAIRHPRPGMHKLEHREPS